MINNIVFDYCVGVPSLPSDHRYPLRHDCKSFGVFKVSAIREIMEPLILAVASIYVVTYICASRLSSLLQSGYMGVMPLPSKAVELNALFDRQAFKGWHYPGSQRGCEGSVETHKVNKWVQQLNASCEKGIRFKDASTVTFVKGGTCTAMALKFVDSYLLHTQATELSLQPPISNQALDEMCETFRTSSLFFRDLQAAFNQIEVVETESLTDPHAAKISAMVGVYGFQVNEVSMTFDTTDSKWRGDLDRGLERLSSGVYLVRSIKPKNNGKLEEYGHSLVCITEADRTLFYDPNYGVQILDSETMTSFIGDALMKLYNYVEVSQTRFYRLGLAHKSAS